MSVAGDDAGRREIREQRGDSHRSGKTISGVVTDDDDRFAGELSGSYWVSCSVPNTELSGPLDGGAGMLVGDSRFESTLCSQFKSVRESVK